MLHHHHAQPWPHLSTHSARIWLLVDYRTQQMAQPVLIGTMSVSPSLLDRFHVISCYAIKMKLASLQKSS